MKKMSINLLGGMVGSLALNALHQTARTVSPEAPRVDKIGEQALSHGLSAIGIDPPVGKKLFAATLAGDVMGNAAYYSAIGLGKKDNVIWRGLAFGMIAGIGAVTLPKKMDLDDRPINRSTATRLMTIVWYTFGGLVTAITINSLRKV